MKRLAVVGFWTGGRCQCPGITCCAKTTEANMKSKLLTLRIISTSPDGKYHSRSDAIVSPYGKVRTRDVSSFRCAATRPGGDGGLPLSW